MSRLLYLLALLLSLPGAARAQDEGQTVVRVILAGDAIAPGLERFLLRALDEAEARNAEAFLLELDTPGGLLQSTRRLVKAFLAADVPVVVYVAPAGSRAASAGTFLTLAAHVAAMAPGTTIGAAHPVSIGGLPVGPGEGPGDGPPGDREAAPAGGATMDKVVNDTVSWARAIAARRGRDADWAEATVRESLSVTAADALAAGAIDLVAEDTAALLDALDGRVVELPSGPRTLRTAGARVERIEMWWGERVLAAISNPNVAFLLLLIGFYGIVFEVTSPGFGVPGVLGVLCLAAAMFGLAMLPVSWIGLGLVLLALGLFVAEAFVPSFGLLGLAGAASLLVGALMLVDSPEGFLRVSWTVAGPAAAATALLVVFLVSNAVRAMRRSPAGGGEGLLAESARALEAFEPDAAGFAGQVLAHGERWRARCPEPVPEGTRLAVVGREGLTLLVSPDVSSPEG